MLLSQAVRHRFELVIAVCAVLFAYILLKPWDMNPQTLKLDPDPKAYVHEGDLCSQPDQDRVVTKVRH